MLVDTHILIWALDNRAGNMGPKTWQLVQEQYDQAIISAVSFFEIRQRQRRGKQLQHIDTKKVLEELRNGGATLLAVSPEQILATPEAKITPHADPFDLLLIAQAITENLPLLTCDAKILEASIPGLRTIDGRI